MVPKRRIKRNPEFSWTQSSPASNVDEPSQELMNSLKKLYSNKEYSDLTISCGGIQHKVHKAIVCPRSDFFAAACRSDFKEGRDGRIDLPDDDPVAVSIMVYYFYHLDYNTPSEEKSLHDEYSEANLAKGDTVEEEEKEEAHSDDDHPGDSTTSQALSPDLTIHARVYALAEKYLINCLKAIALNKFKEEARRNRSPVDLLKAAREVYTSTVDTDRGLRDTIVETLHNHAELLDNGEAQDMLKELNTLTYELLMYVREKGNWHRATYFAFGGGGF